LGALVAKLSAAYNGGDKRAMRSPDGLAARLGFSFARDVPKSSGAVRELVASGALTLSEGRALRVLDIGAGLGASTWGLARALETSLHGRRGLIEAVCIDEDKAALSLASAISEARRGKGAIELRLSPLSADVSHAARLAGGPFDVVLLGQVLSELEDATGDLALVRSAIDAAERGGSIVIVEPALRDRTRRLHALRDEVLAALGREVTVFAPCLHQAPCPARNDESAWCHEDLDVDLPRWLVPVARAAGLRWQGLTFSYLVLRKDGRTLAPERSAGQGAFLRVVSQAIVTKGKREAFVCGELASAGARAPARARVTRLDRDCSEANAVWGDVARGDIVECTPVPEGNRPRISAVTHVRRTTVGRSPP
jgi:ribosomal protein RSM22 (predicted rRNA methylase)